MPKSYKLHPLAIKGPGLLLPTNRHNSANPPLTVPCAGTPDAHHFPIIAEFSADAHVDDKSPSSSDKNRRGPSDTDHRDCQARSVLAVFYLPRHLMVVLDDRHEPAFGKRCPKFFRLGALAYTFPNLPLDLYDTKFSCTQGSRLFPIRRATKGPVIHGTSRSNVILQKAWAVYPDTPTAGAKTTGLTDNP